MKTDTQDQGLSDLLPISIMGDELKRVKLALTCRDCDYLPKVPGAGECFGERQEFQRMHNGVTIYRGSYHGEWMTHVIRELHGHHEPQEEKVFAEVLQHIEPGSAMLELGSFWAYYSLWFQQAVPDAVSIMVEPNADKLEVGKKHFNINRAEGKFIRGFVGAESLPEAVFTDWDGKVSRIPQVSVDDLMRELQLDRLAILHADVQGAEYDMLKGAVAALTNKKIQYLFISTHGFQHRKCIRLLKTYGYQVIAEHSVLQSFSGDGLIVAKSPDCARPGLIPISLRPVSAWAFIRYELAGLKQRLSALLG